MSNTSPDPADFLKNLWSNIGIPLPGMSTPTVDLGELDKRLADLKTVEGWLKMNLNMLQMSIQALEVQRATLSALQTLGQGTSPNTGTSTDSNPFTNPALWPWGFMAQTQASGTPPPATSSDTGKTDQAD
jgi:hypothetical protein